MISDNSTRSLVVNEEQPVKLECYAGGFPIPRVSWRHENNAILPTGGSIYRGNILKIASITKEDHGTYCIAENGVGRGARHNIAVEVEFAPVITVPKPLLEQALQYDIDLKVEAYPPQAIIWLNNGIQLTNNQLIKYHISLLQMNLQTLLYISSQLRNVSTMIIYIKRLTSWELLRSLLIFMKL